MQTKYLNTYSIRHINGQIETVNAETAKNALEVISIAETESKVDSLILTGENIKVAVEDLPTVATFAVSVDNDGFVGEVKNRAYPESITAHIGDKVKCSADIDDRFLFDGWYRGDIRLSTNTDYEYTIQSANDTLRARFVLADVSFTTVNEGGGANSVVFPDTMTVKAGATVKLLAIPATGKTFVKWTRNNIDVSTSARATITVIPRASNETIVKYIAHFS